MTLNAKSLPSTNVNPVNVSNDADLAAPAAIPSANGVVTNIGTNSHVYTSPMVSPDVAGDYWVVVRKKYGEGTKSDMAVISIYSDK